jgi:hypothetical protein
MYADSTNRIIVDAGGVGWRLSRTMTDLSPIQRLLTRSRGNMKLSTSQSISPDYPLIFKELNGIDPPTGAENGQMFCTNSSFVLCEAVSRTSG